MDANRFLRVLVGILLPAGIILACIVAVNPKLSLCCVFYETTGLYCAGCGSGRAISAMIHGEMTEAFWHNPLVFLLGIPSFLILVHEYLRFVFPALRWKPVYLSNAVMWTGTAVIAVFWVLRNIPAFAVLAP